MYRTRITLVFFLWMCTVCASQSSAKTESTQFSPVFKPRLEVSRTTAYIDVDGNLNDEAWKFAARADNFSEHYPGDQTKPPVETNAYVTYDNKNLYVAFVCYDDPALIRASFCERDKIYSDDNVRLCLDTYGNTEYAYIFYVNPYGIQGDAILSSSGYEETSYDLVWQSSGKVTDSGYQVEIAIPFSTLRFSRDNEQTWRADFWRNHPRETKAEYSWSALDRNESCWPCQWGTVSGISEVQPGRGLEIAPSVLAFQSGRLNGTGTAESPYGFENLDPDARVSLWSKYTAASNTTFEATVNPDFSQIESDAGQIDVNSTFALYYPEHRPFFQEGSDLFRAMINSVYTRSINDPEFALKGIRRGNRTSIGYLLARDRNSPYILPGEEGSDIVMAGKSTSNIMRVKHNVGEGSQVGLIINDQRFDNGGNATAFTQDARIRMTPSFRVAYHVAVSRTNEFDDTLLTNSLTYPDTMINDDYTMAFDGESYWGYFLVGQLRWANADWYSYLVYQETNPTFRHPNALFRQTAYRYILCNLGHYFRFNSGFLESVRPEFDIEHEWKYTGDLRYRYISSRLVTRLRSAQASLTSSALLASENFRNRQYDDLWCLKQDVSLQLNDQVSLSGSVTYGHMIARRYETVGKNLDIAAELSVKPHDRILIKQALTFAKSNDIDNGVTLYDGYISRTRFDYQISPPLSIRLIAEYNDFYEQLSIDPLLTYRVNAFSVLYLGMTSRYQSLTGEDIDGGFGESNRLVSRQFFAKLQYLFQL